MFSLSQTTSFVGSSNTTSIASWVAARKRKKVGFCNLVFCLLCNHPLIRTSIHPNLPPLSSRGPPTPIHPSIYISIYPSAHPSPQPSVRHVLFIYRIIDRQIRNCLRYALFGFTFHMQHTWIGEDHNGEHSQYHRHFLTFQMKRA